MAEDEAVSQLDNVLRCSGEDEEMEAVALQRLIQLSRSPSVRNVLATRDAVSFLVRLIALDSSSLLLLLKLLRNICAGNSFNQDSFLHSNGVDSVARVVDRALNLQLHRQLEMGSTLQVCLQLLGNACGAGSAQRDAVWNAFFPDRFRNLALVKDEGNIMDPLCMVIYTCCHGNIQRLEDLCHRDGALLLSSCLQAVSLYGVLCKGAGDWLHLLLLELCSKESLVPLLFAHLQGPFEEGIQECQFSAEQVALLACLLDVLVEEHSHDIIQQNKADLHAMIELLAQILRDASRCYLTSHLTTSNIVLHTTCPCNIPVIDVLGYTLELLKAFSGLECGDQDSGSSFDRTSVVDKLLQEGVIKLCIELLEGMGPPELIVRAMQRSNADVNNRGHKLNGIDVQEGFRDNAEEPLKVTRAVLPYRGYRRDLVAVIGNAAYRNRAVQDAVRHFGGLFLLLQQCVVDEANPYLREWGLWAIRNLVENNMENSKELAELQLRGSFTPVELAEMGYKVEMDSALGRPKLVNLPSGNG